MKPLFVTSGNETMYRLNGRDLVQSISERYPIFVCYEGFDVDVFNPNVLTYPIMTDQWLLDWLFKNKNIIPVEIGGELRENNIEYYNRNTSKWMRKVASIRYALNQAISMRYDALIWIDMDTKINKSIDDDLIDRSFRDADCFYHTGFLRNMTNTGIESGVIGFKGQRGTQICDEWFRQYESGDFLNLKRWDDGYVIRHVIRSELSSSNGYNYRCRDLTNEALIRTTCELITLQLGVTMLVGLLAYSGIPIGCTCKSLGMFVSACNIWLITVVIRSKYYPLGPSMWNDYVTHEKGLHKKIGARE